MTEPPETEFVPIDAKYKNTATPRLVDSDIKQLVKKYPVSQQLGLQ